MSTATPKFRPTACVLVVGLDDATFETIRDASKPVQAIRAIHPSAAIERMLVTQPLVVVFGRELPARDQEDLLERAAAIGADVVRPEAFPTREKLASRIAVGILTAEQRRL